MRIVFSLLFILTVFSLKSQRFEVESFKMVPNDLTAQRQPRIDYNGSKCALIKIYTSDKIAEVRENVVGEVESVGFEKQVYVTDGTKELEIIFENHYPLHIKFSDYLYPVLNQPYTYVLELSESNQGVNNVALQQVTDSLNTSMPSVSQSVSNSTNSQEVQKIVEEMKQAYENGNYSKTMELALSIQDNPEAQILIGDLYWLGKGVKMNNKTAREWYQKVADQGNGHAMFMVGLTYDLGFWKAIDSKEAMKWFLKGADAGNAESVNMVGLLYEKGRGVKKDYAEAMKWYEKAVDLGYANAMYNIGELYEKGHGVTKDLKEALKWYERALEAGLDSIKNKIKKLKKKVKD